MVGRMGKEIDVAFSGSYYRHSMPLQDKFSVAYLWQVHFPHQRMEAFKVFKLSPLNRCVSLDDKSLLMTRTPRLKQSWGLSVLHIEPLRNGRTVSLKGINKRKIFLPNFFCSLFSVSFVLRESGVLIRILQNKHREEFYSHSVVQHYSLYYLARFLCLVQFS